MNKYAAIDIGTNSMRLLLANVEAGKIISRSKYINPTRIGSSVDKDKLISEEGMSRNIEALYNFTQKAKDFGAEKILVIATSAVRDATNGKEFIQRAYEKTGVNIEIISGEEEAALGYQGVAMGLKSKAGKQVVIDIGGGSTEFILGEGNALKKTISLNVGAVRMTERCITTDPISKEQYEEMEVAIYEIVKEVVEETKKDSPNTIVGIGGTITTLAALHQQLDPYHMDKVHNYKLTLKDISTLKEKLLNLTVEEIKQLKGIHPKRADIIVAGVTILNVIMDNLNIYEITVSEYDNLEGLLFPIR